MSLFDDDFKISFESTANLDSVLEGKCKKECDKEDCDDKDDKDKKDDDDEEDEEPEDEKIDEDAEADEVEEAAADFDLSCGSLSEIQGSPAIASAVEENAFLTMEAMAIQMAFDRTDTVLTEAYQVAETDARREQVTESFKETVKKYWERFKGFLGKIKNLIVRTAQRFVGYIKTLFTRISAKIASRKGAVKDAMKVSYAKAGTVKSYQVLTNKNLSNFLYQVCMPDKDVFKKLDTISNEVTVGNAADKKKEVGDLTLVEKSKVVSDALGTETDVDITAFGTLQEILKVVENPKAAISSIDSFKKDTLGQISKEESSVKGMKDIDSAVMSVKIAIVNKRVALYNRQLSLLNTFTILWLNARIKALKALTSAGGKKKEATNESATLIDSFMDMGVF